MNQPLDPFAQNFDSINVDPARTPSKAAFDSAMAQIAQHADRPGFYLVDDAMGRFIADCSTGVISLKDDALLERERGAVHPVRLRVVEQSGASYHLDMQLRITGLVPQMVGAENLAAIAGIAAEPSLIAERIPALITAVEAPAPQPQPIAWTRFSAAHGHLSRAQRLQPRRSFIAAEAPATDAEVALDFAGLPAPFDAHLPWSL